jgi:steroid delta-isomerase-like uncharacterized protein
MSAEENKAALDTAVQAWNKGDGEAFLALHDPSIRHHGLGPEPLDHAGNRAFYEAFWAAFPGSQLTIDDVVAEGDRLAARFHIEGEHKGDFMGVPATGRPFVLHGHTTMQFSGGRVLERWTTADRLGLLTQLGVIPPPGA